MTIYKHLSRARNFDRVGMTSRIWVSQKSLLSKVIFLNRAHQLLNSWRRISPLLLIIMPPAIKIKSSNKMRLDGFINGISLIRTAEKEIKSSMFCRVIPNIHDTLFSKNIFFTNKIHVFLTLKL